MAQILPAKRPRGLTDHSQGSNNGIAGPSRNKRPRNSIEPSERSYSEDVESRYLDDEEQASTVPDDEGDDENAYMRATQMVQKTLRKQQQNVPAEAGIIEEIRCTNFMCHEQLTVTLGPLINFIIGHNGSGKSAVLTALTLCLGGKATATNRGQNLKSFIKNGREFSVLSVKIKNQGSAAYKSEQYGDSIIVERHFNRSGASGFKLKDRNGKIVSTKKAELEDIIDAFAMQIDNPMNVLTQDMARQFLNDSNPKDKYRFFLRGTQLETLSRDYKQIAQESEEQEARAQTLLGDVKIYKEKYLQALEKAKRAKNLENMRAKEAKLAHQAAWAQVVTEEKELASIDTELGSLSKLIDQKKAEADAESENYTHADQGFDRARAEVQECQAELQPAEDEVKELRAKFTETRDQIMKLKSDERAIVGQMKTSKKSVQDTQSQIQDHKDRQAEADNGVHAQRVNELAEAKAAYEECKEAWETHDEGLSELNVQLNAARGQKSQVDARLQQKRADESQSRKKLRDLEQGQRKWIDAYPNPASLERLIHAIEQEGRFREHPVGPMGRYVELTKPEWGYILEKSFGSALNAFVVTSKADHTVLSEMMRKYNYHAPILIGKRDPIDTSGHEPDEQLLTWMRALKITNELVRNQLIINQSIDQVVLIQKRSDGQDFMKRSPSERINVKHCFSMSDGSRRLGHIITVSQSSGGSSIGPIDEFRGTFRMQADKGPQIQDEKDNLASIQQEIRNIEAGARAAQDQLNTCQAKIHNHQKQKKHLKVRMDRAHEDMGRLEEEVNTSTPDAAVIEQLELQLAEAKSQVVLDENQYMDFTKRKDTVDEMSRSIKNQLEEADKIVQEIKFRLDKLNAKAQTRAHRREQALRRKNTALEEVQSAENDRSDWELKRAEQENLVNQTVEQASGICARVNVPPNETFESLIRKQQRLIKERELSEKELGGSEEELLRIATEAKKTYNDASQEIKSTENFRRLFKVALNTRNDRWRKFRQEISVLARVTFNYLLSERQFRGSLSIDHKSERLDIHIQPDITVNSNTGRQTKTLSGGEKSFSTICLLLALWDAMGSPIRCLDEFDVFMDNVNREIAMKLIVGAARRSVGRQYILITPQAMNRKQLDDADDVKIILMNEPERGQTALNFNR